MTTEHNQPGPHKSFIRELKRQAWKGKSRGNLYKVSLKKGKVLQSNGQSWRTMAVLKHGAAAAGMR
jgi:hypothetical protein